ncbi:hypothetical protein NPIL_113911 [Nephila pilipes]|uniref:Uncharacterized protein n=1 Tax=Nephila pilipes TaxID=299642 RepID=A0A8X6QGG1_NEPPI|nr:hypothetical protein NPIL_113911 [Nephila pilipes]
MDFSMKYRSRYLLRKQEEFKCIRDEDFKRHAKERLNVSLRVVKGYLLLFLSHDLFSFINWAVLKASPQLSGDFLFTGWFSSSTLTSDCINKNHGLQKSHCTNRCEERL